MPCRSRHRHPQPIGAWCSSQRLGDLGEQGLIRPALVYSKAKLCGLL
jgi:hypothetical protein